MEQNCNIIRFEEVDSTNSRLYACRRFLPSGTVFSASFQSSGRGQKGNVWSAGRGENLTFSLLYKPVSIPAASQFLISAAASLGITDYLKENGIGATIKWPNDIYVGNSKICGMLIENSLFGAEISSSVVGIGFNLNQTSFGKDLPNPVSASLLTGRKYDVDIELDKLLKMIFRRLDEAENGKDLTGEYESLLYRRGVECEWLDCRKAPMTNLTASDRTVEGGVKISGKIIGTDENGRLKLQLKSGQVTLFSFKEIRYLNIYRQQDS